MDKIQNPSNSECCTPSSEPFRIYQPTGSIYFACVDLWTSHYWVLGTDYKTYSIVRGCLANDKAHRKYCIAVRMLNIFSNYHRYIWSNVC
jgi:hypothetical protein